MLQGEAPNAGQQPERDREGDRIRTVTALRRSVRTPRIPGVPAGRLVARLGWCEGGRRAVVGWGCNRVRVCADAEWPGVRRCPGGAPAGLPLRLRRCLHRAGRSLQCTRSIRCGARFSIRVGSTTRGRPVTTSASTSASTIARLSGSPEGLLACRVRGGVGDRRPAERRHHTACISRRLEVGHFDYWHVSPVVAQGEHIRAGHRSAGHASVSGTYTCRNGRATEALVSGSTRCTRAESSLLIATPRHRS